MSGTTQHFPREEPIRLCRRTMRRIALRQGRCGAEQAYTTAYEIILSRLREMRLLMREGDLVGIALRADALATLAGAVAMCSLGCVARDVYRCAGRGERAALAATLDRLHRVADRSIAGVLRL